MVLAENRSVKQERAGRRRWFEDDEIELIVWYRPAGEIEGFQICYGRPDDGQALTWRLGTGFALDRIDAGDATPLKNETPILAPDGAIPWAEITALFLDRSVGLEAPLRDLVLKKLADKNGRVDSRAPFFERRPYFVSGRTITRKARSECHDRFWRGRRGRLW